MWLHHWFTFWKQISAVLLTFFLRSGRRTKTKKRIFYLALGTDVLFLSMFSLVILRCRHAPYPAWGRPMPPTKLIQDSHHWFPAYFKRIHSIILITGENVYCLPTYTCPLGAVEAIFGSWDHRRWHTQEGCKWRKEGRTGGKLHQEISTKFTSPHF